jgi:hypothetical protein
MQDSQQHVTFYDGLASSGLNTSNVLGLENGSQEPSRVENCPVFWKPPHEVKTLQLRFL